MDELRQAYVNGLVKQALQYPDGMTYQSIAPSYTESGTESNALPLAGAALGLGASIPGARLMGERSVQKATPGIRQGLQDEVITQHNGRLAANNAMRKRERERSVDQIKNLDQRRGNLESTLNQNREMAGNADNGKLKQLYYDQKVKSGEKKVQSTKAQLDTENRLFRNARPMNQDPAKLKQSLDAIPDSKAFKDATHSARVKGAKVGGFGGALLGAATLGGAGHLVNKLRESRDQA